MYLKTYLNFNFQLVLWTREIENKLCVPLAFCFVFFFEIFGQSNVPLVRYICNDALHYTFLSESSYMWLHVNATQFMSLRI